MEEAEAEAEAEVGVFTAGAGEVSAAEEAETEAETEIGTQGREDTERVCSASATSGSVPVKAREGGQNDEASQCR